MSTSTGSCAVCGTAGTKYKCPACKALSCSLPCFKAHGLECSSSSTTRPNTNTGEQHVEGEPGTTSATGTDVGMRNDTTTTNEKKDSFNTAEVQALFVKYPRLKAKLGSIYEVTLDPNSKKRDVDDGAAAATASSSAAGARRGRSSDRRYERAWNPEKGFERGLDTLREAIDAAGPEAEGLEEFLKLVGGGAR